MHKIFIDPRAMKQLTVIRSVDQKRIIARIDSLSAEPRPPGYKKLHGNEELYRVRVGDYRIVYQIKDDELVVLIIRIGHRREIYR